MKARTKAQKLRTKRGRPRIEDIDRTPAGRISRAQVSTARRDDTNQAEVVDMRSRLYGATGENAKLPEWGYVLGRIWIDGKLGDKEGKGKLRLVAGDRYARDMARYYALTGIPFPSPRAQTLFQVRGHDGEVSEERALAARTASNLMMSLEGAILKAGRNAASAVKSVCLHDIDEARGWPEHMFTHLRCGLDELIWKYGLMSDGKSSKDEII